MSRTVSCPATLNLWLKINRFIHSVCTILKRAIIFNSKKVEETFERLKYSHLQVNRRIVFTSFGYHCHCRCCFCFRGLFSIIRLMLMHRMNRSKQTNVSAIFPLFWVEFKVIKYFFCVCLSLSVWKGKRDWFYLTALNSLKLSEMIFLSSLINLNCLNEWKKKLFTNAFAGREQSTATPRTKASTCLEFQKFYFESFPFGNEHLMWPEIVDIRLRKSINFEFIESDWNHNII